MRRKYSEQIFRMRELIYGKELIHESEKSKKIVKKAEIVKDDVSDFFENLDSILSNIEEEQRGSIQYKKQVESVQIGLLLLGYDLPRFGVDGKFGPETAKAVSEFKKNNNISDISTSKESDVELSEMSTVQLNKTSFSNVKFDKDSTQYDSLNKALLDDLQTAAQRAGVVATITTAKSGHRTVSKSGHTSRHMFNTAADIAIIDGYKYGDSGFRIAGDKLVKELEKMGYVRNKEMGNTKAVIWQSNVGGNHFNHIHVSNKSGDSGSEVSSSSQKETITPEMVKIMIKLLKERGVTSQDLKSYTISNVNISMTGDWLEITKKLLRKHEGFQPTAKWDENAFRGGYGTNKKLVNGRLEKATRSTTWTKQEAEETMDYEIKNFYAPTIARQLGIDNWNKLNDRQKASLISLGYNAGPYFVTARDYGRQIKKAIENNDIEKAAQYIAQGPTTGTGTGTVYSGLQRRRKEESQIFMS